MAIIVYGKAATIIMLQILYVPVDCRSGAEGEEPSLHYLYTLSDCTLVYVCAQERRNRALADKNRAKEERAERNRQLKAYIYQIESIEYKYEEGRA